MIRKVKKLMALMLAVMIAVSGTDSFYAADESYGSRISEMFQGNVAKNENTWLFAGGIETQGRFAEIGGARNYVGHFEEYIRGTKQGTEMDRQRYMINVGQSGCDLLRFAQKMDSYIESFDPRAVDYMIGKEDYSKGTDGLDAFGDAVDEVISKALALRDGNGFMVIQFPHAVKDEQENNVIVEYVEKVRVIASAKDESERDRIVLVDHYTQTNTDDFKNTKLLENGLLNADGHYEIAKQLARGTYGSDGQFRALVHWTKEEAPETFLDVMPEVKAGEDCLDVAIPDDVTGEEWNYQITVDDMEISGTASGKSFVIKNLPADAEYELMIRSTDGTLQMEAVEGRIEEGFRGTGRELSPLQQEVVDKVNYADELTWLFMGDSITHGLLHTHGYDSISQTFEKYVKEDLGRAKDIVFNTGNSATTAGRTLENIEQRLKKYNPDIVAVMLGTNDAKTDSTETYIQNMQAILDAIKETNPDALIILRSPTPVNPSGRDANQFIPKLDGENGYIAALKKFAEEQNVLYIDQYTDWKKEFDAYPYLFGYYFGDYLHPGAVGQMRLAREFIRGCGLNSDTVIANHSYQKNFSYTEADIDKNPPLEVIGNTVKLDRNSLQELYDIDQTETLGDVTVVLTDRDGRTYKKNIKPDETELIMNDIPVSRHYTASVTALILGGTPKRVTFADSALTLSSGTEEEDVNRRLNELEDIFNGSQGHYTEESLSEFQKTYRRVQDSAGQETDVEILADLLDELNAAYGMLQVDQEFMEAEKALKDALGTYEAALNSDREKYTENSWLLFSEACRKAKEAVQQGGKSKDELKTLLSGMQEAFQALEERTKKLAAPAIKSLKAVSEKKAFGVKIEVEAVPDADAYTVYRTAGGKETVIGRTDATKAVYDENPVGGQESLYYAVAESSAKGFETSDKGAPKTIRLAAAAKKIKAKQPKGKAQASVTWKAAKGAKSYIVYRSEKKDAGYVRLATVKGAKKTAYLDRKAKKGKTFYYKVVVKTKTGYGAPAVSKAVKIK